MFPGYVFGVATLPNEPVEAIVSVPALTVVLPVYVLTP